MERLTMYDEHGNVVFADETPSWGDMREWSNKNWNAIIQKLSEYEDNNLTSERVAELAKAEAEGRLVVLPPCKSGDVFYQVNPIGITPPMVAHKLYDYVVSGGELYFRVKIDDTLVKQRYEYFSCSGLGGTLFLTREEAEVALKGMLGNE